ncbi:hypothetical protein [Winogradskyella sp. R77965]|uniref:hypothetical protein n=1 Tax=Winogradskyella sp. R77965 TaxID=3093872 RepID=UPI0037DC27B6
MKTYNYTIVTIILLILLSACSNDDDNNTANGEVNIIQSVIAEENLSTISFLVVSNPPEVERGVVFSTSINGEITKIGRSDITGDATIYRIFDVANHSIIQEFTIPDSGVSNMLVLATPISIEAGKKYIISSNNTKPYGVSRQDAQDFLPSSKNNITLEKTVTKDGPPGTLPDAIERYDILYGVPLFVFSPN